MYMPKEETFSIPLKYIDATRTTYLWTYCWRNIEDYWNVDGERELSDAWTGFTRFVLLKERPLAGSTWSGGDLQGYNQPLVLMMYDQKEESKTKMGYPKTRTRQCQTIERNILHRAKRRRIPVHNERRSETVGSFDASSNALQNTD